MGRRKLLARDTFLWIGNEAIHVWDQRNAQVGYIPFINGSAGEIPYVPKFHSVWEDSPHYQEELRGLLGKRRRRVLLAVPEDATAIERTALEDFVHAAIGDRLKRLEGLAVCTQSQVLRASSGTFIALTSSCRCCCVALVRDGEVQAKTLLDAAESSRTDLFVPIRDYRSKHPSGMLDIYYPQTEENQILAGLGTPVSFEQMIEYNF